MSTSNKTHHAQRRPAAIPADAELTPDDKKAIKLRTGQHPVYFHPAAATAGQRTDKEKDGVKVVEEELKKRKPSTTAEQYHDNYGDVRKNPGSNKQHHAGLSCS